MFCGFLLYVYELNVDLVSVRLRLMSEKKVTLVR